MRLLRSRLHERQLSNRPLSRYRNKGCATPLSFDCVLINRTIVNHDGVGPRDIGIRDGRIAEIGALSGAAARERIDCRGLHILPGVIDSQVHEASTAPTKTTNG